MVAGLTTSFEGDVKGNHGCDDVWILKLDKNGNIQWSKCYGGDYFDEAQCIHQTADGGFIVGAITYSFDGDITDNHGMCDFWVLKLDSSGNLQWQKCYGGNKRDVLVNVVVTASGDYLLVGSKQLSQEEPEGAVGLQVGYIVRIKSDGSIIWEKTLIEQFNGIQSAVETNDQGFILTGNAYSDRSSLNPLNDDVALVKTDRDGNVQWSHSYGGKSDENGTFVGLIPNNKILLLTGTFSNDGNVTGNHGQADGWMLILDSVGRILQRHCYGGALNEILSSGLIDNNNNFIMTGVTSSMDGDINGNHGLNDAWIMKVNSDGKLVWQECLGGSKDDETHCIIKTNNDGYVVAGWTESDDWDVSTNKGQQDVWIVKLKPDFP